MLTIRVKKQFKKDLKKALTDPRRDIALMQQLIQNHLVLTGMLPQQYFPHPLVGNWRPHWECHIQPDFLLIWAVDWDERTLILARCGSHAELFG